jgi:hypothetical protein
MCYTVQMTGISAFFFLSSENDRQVKTLDTSADVSWRGDASALREEQGNTDGYPLDMFVCFMRYSRSCRTKSGVALLHIIGPWS